MSGSATEPVPSAATAGPMTQQMIGNFDAMTPEQLQEAVMRYGGSPQGQIAQRILARKRVMGADPGQVSGPPQQYSLGGSMNPKGGMHIPERGITAPSGLLATAGPGRTDNLNIHPHADSYVLPADVVSGLGEGNTQAGAKLMDMALHSGPHGIPMPSGGSKSIRPIKAPRMGFSGGPRGVGNTRGFGLAQGGQAPDVVPIVAAGGEYVISPEKCREVGGGDLKRGHRILDAFVLHCRKTTIKDLRKLKGPVKS